MTNSATGTATGSDTPFTADGFTSDVENPFAAGAETPGNTPGMAMQIKDRAKAAGSSLKDEAGSLKAQAADKARSAADSGKAKAAGALGEVGKFLEDSAARIDEQFGPTYGDYARKAARTVEGFASGLDNKAVDDLVADARGFVKNNPVIAIGAAAAIGFILTRVVKAGLDD